GVSRPQPPAAERPRECGSVAHLYDAALRCGARAAHSAGLDPMGGFYPQPARGRESLACDLIEPLRPRADAWIWTLFRERALRGGPTRGSPSIASRGSSPARG